MNYINKIIDFQEILYLKFMINKSHKILVKFGIINYP